MDICYQALSLVTDYVQDPKDFVKLCLVNKALCHNRRKALLALDATRPHAYHHRRQASIYSAKFKNPDVRSGLEEIWRFHARNELLTLYLSTEQAEFVDANRDSRRLRSEWRPILRELVNVFYERCKLMRRSFPRLNNHDCYFDLECSDTDNLLRHEWGTVGSWFFDNDMIIFESVTVFHMRNAVNLTDNGIMQLKSAEEIFLSDCKKVRGASFLYLHAHKVLYHLMLVGSGENMFDAEIFRCIREPPVNKKRLYQGCPLPLMTNLHIDV